MTRDIVYFDLETQRTANDAGGWDKKRDMGMSVGVTYSTKLGEYRIYNEKQVDALIEAAPVTGQVLDDPQHAWPSIW